MSMDVNVEIQINILHNDNLSLNIILLSDGHMNIVTMYSLYIYMAHRVLVVLHDKPLGGMKGGVGPGRGVMPVSVEVKPH